MSKQFKDLEIGETFYCWGDQCINYDYPAWCECVKLDVYMAQEKGGMKFGINPSTYIVTEEENKENPF